MSIQKFSEWRKQRKNAMHKRISLKWKWSASVGIGILISFAIFSLILFQSFSSVMLEQERNNVKDTVSVVVDRLAVEKGELTVANVAPKLRPESTGGITLIPKDKQPDNNLYSDSIIMKLAREDVSVGVYDTTGNLIFSSRENGLKFKKTSNQVVTREKIDGISGFVGRAPITSKINGNIIGFVQVTNQLDGYNTTIGKLRNVFYIVSLIAVVLSLIIGYMLAAMFLKPIKLMTRTIDEINSEPQSDVRIPKLRQNDELSDLTLQFNEMLDRMQRYIEQQEQFVEDVSHELRTPVAIIEGHLQMLNRWGKDDPEILAESLSASLQEIERMKSLVQEMLDLSRAEQVEVHYNNAFTDIKEVANQVFNNFVMLYPDFYFNIDDDLEPGTMVNIYRNHFEQIMIILMDNAVKYSNKRKEIHVIVTTWNNMVEVAVQDYGDGIASEDVEKVFNRFYRVDKARSREKGGNGLGLSIVERLLESYHGTIKLISQPGSGSTFRVFLPIPNKENNAAGSSIEAGNPKAPTRH